MYIFLSYLFLSHLWPFTQMIEFCLCSCDTSPSCHPASLSSNIGSYPVKVDRGISWGRLIQAAESLPIKLVGQELNGLMLKFFFGDPSSYHLHSAEKITSNKTMWCMWLRWSVDVLFLGDAKVCGPKIQFCFHQKFWEFQYFVAWNSIKIHVGPNFDGVQRGVQRGVSGYPQSSLWSLVVPYVSLKFVTETPRVLYPLPFNRSPSGNQEGDSNPGLCNPFVQGLKTMERFHPVISQHLMGCNLRRCLGAHLWETIPWYHWSWLRFSPKNSKFFGSWISSGIRT